jgi:cytochrome c6
MKWNRPMAMFLGVALMLLITTGFAAAQDTPEAVYKAKCALCHAADGSGNTPAGKKLEVQDFKAPDVAKLSDAVFFDITKKGKGKMPAYDGKLTDAQINDLVKYIRGLEKAK